MLRPRLPMGSCCSCGRDVRRRGARVCPYCGEAVLWPIKWRLAGWMAAFLPFALTLMLAVNVHTVSPRVPDGNWNVALFYAAWAIALAPMAEDAPVATTVASVFKSRLLVLAGTLFAMLICWFDVRFFAAAAPAAVLSALGLFALPLFWSLPYRLGLAMSLLWISYF